MLRLSVIVTAIALLEGCGAGWRQPTGLFPDALEPRQQVQVWRQGAVLRWHGVVITADTVSGVPFHRPLACDSCRVAVPRATVDSVRVGNPVAGFWKSVGLVIGTLLAVCVAACPREMQ